MPRTVAEINRIIRTLTATSRDWGPTAVGVVAEESRDPFRILISCLISLRTKDEVTAEASTRLFRLATAPRSMADGLEQNHELKTGYNHSRYAIRRRVLRFLLRWVGFPLLAKIDRVDRLRTFPMKDRQSL